MYWVPATCKVQEKGIFVLFFSCWNWVTGDYDLIHGCWKLNLSLLQEKGLLSLSICPAHFLGFIFINIESFHLFVKLISRQDFKFSCISIHTLILVCVSVFVCVCTHTHACIPMPLPSWSCGVIAEAIISFYQLVPYRWDIKLNWWVTKWSRILVAASHVFLDLHTSH